MGDIRLRRVDIQSEYYKVARQYMIRLEPSDFSDPEMRTALTESGNMPPGEFNTAIETTNEPIVTPAWDTQ